MNSIIDQQIQDNEFIPDGMNYETAKKITESWLSAYLINHIIPINTEFEKDRMEQAIGIIQLLNSTATAYLRSH